MRSRTWSTVLAGAALALTLLPSPAAAAEPGSHPRDFWHCAESWAVEVWSHVTDLVTWGIDPDGSASLSDPEPPTGLTSDVTWGIDPDG